MNKNNIFEDLNAENFRRMKVLSIVFLALGIYNLITDYLSLNLWGEEVIEAYKILDIVFATLSLFAVIYFWSVKNIHSKFNNLAVKFTVSYLVLWAVFVCGLDFSASGISTYIAVLLLSLFYLHFKPLFYSALIWVSSILLLSIVYFSPESQSDFMPTLFLLTPIIIIATLISRRYYKEKINSLNIFYENKKLTYILEQAKNNLEEEVEEKTKNLTETNLELDNSRNNLKLEKDRFEALIDKLQQGVLYLNTEGEILEVNQSIIQILGSPSVEATKSINILNFQPLIEHGFTEKYIECIERKRTTSGNGLYKTKWGIELFVEYYFVPIMENEKLVGVLACLEDFTERKRIENDLILAKEKAEHSDRLKSAFLANMSHEIRTPMNGILGFTSLLLEPHLSDGDKAQYVDIINKSGERMLNTVNDIIEISKIEAGIVEVKNLEIDVFEVLKRLLDFFQMQAQTKGLTLRLENKITETSLYINTDKSKFESILTNLIKNAIKFTDIGKIEVSYCINDGFVQFCVKDSGIGVPQNRIKSIFNRFEQADIKDSRAFQGSGLGLAISKSFVEMLGGKIWVESEKGKGTTFFFTLPKK